MQLAGSDDALEWLTLSSSSLFKRQSELCGHFSSQLLLHLLWTSSLHNHRATAVQDRGQRFPGWTQKCLLRSTSTVQASRVEECSPGRQGLDRAEAALSSRSSSLGLRQADSSESAWWVGTFPTPKPPDGPGLGSSDPRTSITWLFTLDILLRTSAIWALRRISTPESGTDRLTTWGRLSRSFRECGWAEGKKTEKTKLYFINNGPISTQVFNNLKLPLQRFIVSCLQVSHTHLGCAAETRGAEAEDPTETPRCCAPSGPAAGSEWPGRYPEGCCCWYRWHQRRRCFQRCDVKNARRSWIHLQEGFVWVNHIPIFSSEYQKSPGPKSK